MTEAIDPGLFEHLVHLAALELAPEEAEYLRRELNNQLEAIHELEAIPLDPTTSATSHGIPYTGEIQPSLRPDAWEPFADAQDILSQAPETSDDYFVVPDIPHEELE